MATTNIAASCPAYANHNDGEAIYAVSETATPWISGRFPSPSEPDSLSISFGGVPRNVDEILLIPNRTPTTGFATHDIYARDANWRMVHISTHEGSNTHGVPITIEPGAKGKNLLHLEIRTTQNDSWTAWQEIKVLGEDNSLARSNLRYFGYWYCDLMDSRQRNIIHDHCNIAWQPIGHPESIARYAKLAAAADARLLFTFNRLIQGKQTELWSLNGLWEAHGYDQEIEAHRDQIWAIQIAEEPFHKTGNHSIRENHFQVIQAAADKIKKRHGINTLLNIADADLRGNGYLTAKGTLPPAVDIVSFNAYLSHNNVDVFYRDIMPLVDRMHELAHPHQRFVATGDGMMFKRETVTQRSEALRVRRCREYFNLCLKLHSFVGIVPFLFQPPKTSDLRGLPELSSVLHEYDKIGSQIGDSAEQ